MGPFDQCGSGDKGEKEKSSGNAGNQPVGLTSETNVGALEKRDFIRKAGRGRAT